MTVPAAYQDWSWPYRQHNMIDHGRTGNIPRLITTVPAAYHDWSRPYRQPTTINHDRTGSIPRLIMTVPTAYHFWSWLYRQYTTIDQDRTGCILRTYPETNLYNTIATSYFWLSRFIPVTASATSLTMAESFRSRLTTSWCPSRLLRHSKVACDLQDLFVSQTWAHETTVASFEVLAAGQ